VELECRNRHETNFCVLRCEHPTVRTRHDTMPISSARMPPRCRGRRGAPPSVTPPPGNVVSVRPLAREQTEHARERSRTKRSSSAKAERSRASIQPSASNWYSLRDTPSASPLGGEGVGLAVPSVSSASSIPRSERSPRQQADAEIQLGLRARLAGGRRAGGRRAALLLPRADERRQQALGAGVALSCAAALQSVHAQPRLDAHARGVPAKRCASSQAARAPTRRTCRGRASRQSRQTCRPLARARRGCAPPVGLYRQPASPAPPPDRRRRLGRGGH
jgi:hypothetical protein